MDLEKRRQAAINAELMRAAQLSREIGADSKAAVAAGRPATDGALNRGVAQGGGALTISPVVDAPRIPSAAELAESARVAKVGKLRGDIRGRQGEVDDVYNALFADLDTLIGSRKQEIDKTTGETIGKLTDQYVGSIPKIESSYTALGAGDSTDNTYAKVDAKTGYDDSVKEVGKQKDKDLTTLGEYDATTRAGWNADREALGRIFSRLDETDNEQDLTNTRNDVENKIGTAKASRASLMTDQGLKGTIAKGTDGAGRLASIQSSLDTILQSSLSNGVKQAAIAAVGQSAGLTDEEKNQIKANSGYTS